MLFMNTSIFYPEYKLQNLMKHKKLLQQNDIISLQGVFFVCPSTNDAKCLPLQYTCTIKILLLACFEVGLTKKMESLLLQ